MNVSKDGASTISLDKLSLCPTTLKGHLCQGKGRAEGKEKRLLLHLLLPLHIPLGGKYKISPLPPTSASLHFSPRRCLIFTSFATLAHSLSYLQALHFSTDPFTHKVRFPFNPSQIPSQFLLEKRNRLTGQQSFVPSCPEQHPCTQGHSAVLEADEQYPCGL